MDTLAKNKPINVDQLMQQEAANQLKQDFISEEFVKEYTPIVEAIATNIAARGNLPTGVEFGDLKSWGLEGLIKAKNNYDESKGSQFKTYAYYRIRGEIFDKIRQEWSYRNPTDYQKHKKMIQERIAEYIEEAMDTKSTGKPPEQSVGDIIANSAMVCLISLDNIENIDGEEGADEVEKKENYSHLWSEVDNLNTEEQTLIKLFYLEGLKQKEIADQLNFSRSKVCRIHMKALDKLKKSLKKRFGTDAF